MSQGIQPNILAPRMLVWKEGAHQWYWMGKRHAPLWVWRRGPWRRVIPAAWHPLEQLPGDWWLGQWQRHIAIIGQGVRPALALERVENEWQALLPAGRQSLVVMVPDFATYEVRPLQSTE